MIIRHQLINMQPEEYARIFRNKYQRIFNHNGIIWMEVRPLFWRPLFPFYKYDYDNIFIPFSFYLGGFQYPILNNNLANSTINYYIFNDVKNYSIDDLERKQRQDIVRSMRRLHVKIEVDPEVFIKKSYPVYISFMKRTRYGYRHDRLRWNVYNKWWRKIFSSGKFLIIGAYNKDILAGVMVLAYVDGVVVLVTTYSHTDYLSFGSTELLFHEARMLSSKVEDARFIFAGNKNDHYGVNNYKENRGAVLVKSPSYYYINPIALNMLKLFGDKYLNKIAGDIRNQ